MEELEEFRGYFDNLKSECLEEYDIFMEKLESEAIRACANGEWAWLEFLLKSYKLASGDDMFTKDKLMWLAKNDKDVIKKYKVKEPFEKTANGWKVNKNGLITYEGETQTVERWCQIWGTTLKGIWNRVHKKRMNPMDAMIALKDKKSRTMMPETSRKSFENIDC